MHRIYRTSIVFIAFVWVFWTSPSQAGGWYATSKGCDVWNESPEPNESVVWLMGDCVDGKVSGIGVLVWTFDTDGGQVSERYVGEYKNGKANGEGTYYFSNGNRYEGQYNNDKRHGQGTVYYVSGNRFTGQYENDLAVNGTCYFIDGSIKLCHQESDGSWAFK